MAGRGRAPKDPSKRRNRAVPQRGEWVDLKPLEKAVLPELPATLQDDKPWPEETKEAWRMWRRDAVTSRYSDSDIAFALDTIRVHARMPTTAAEVRMRMDILGLSPKGKRDNRWRVAEDRDDKPEANAPEVPADDEIARRRAARAAA